MNDTFMTHLKAKKLVSLKKQKDSYFLRPNISVKVKKVLKKHFESNLRMEEKP
jgi:hypothetical protein